MHHINARELPICRSKTSGLKHRLILEGFNLQKISKLLKILDLKSFKTSLNCAFCFVLERDLQIIEIKGVS